MFHLQTDLNGVHQKGHWGYCNVDLGLFVRNSDEGGDCPMPKTDKPSPKPATTTTQKPHRRTVCKTKQFQCLNGDCIPAAYVCDTKKDCQDGSDEIDCLPGEKPKI